MPITPDMSNAYIAGMLLTASLTNAQVAVGTLNPGQGKVGIPLPGQNAAQAHFDHSYIVVTVGTNNAGVYGVTLLNPWGPGSGVNYQIFVPLDDFSKLFDGIYLLNE